MTKYLEKVEMVRNTVKECGIDIHSKSFVALYKRCYNKYHMFSQFNFYVSLDRELERNKVLFGIRQAIEKSENEWITAKKIVEVSKLNIPLEFIENLLLTRVDKTDNTKVIRVSDILEQKDSQKIKSNYLFNINNLKVIF